MGAVCHSCQDMSSRWRVIGESLALAQCGKTISLLVEHSPASGLGGQRLVSVTQYTYCKNYSRRRRYVATTECYCCSSHHLVPSRNAGHARTLTLLLEGLLVLAARIFVSPVKWGWNNCTVRRELIRGFLRGVPLLVRRRVLSVGDALRYP
jgi:hypothetical protein